VSRVQKLTTIDMEFFRDKKKKFECNIMVDGANMANTSARMLLEFKDQTLLFKGKVDATGRCTIEIPPLKNIFESAGNATLEVIADSTVFEPWKSDFILKDSKAVKVIEMEEVMEEKAEEKIKVKVDVKPEPESKPAINESETADSKTTKAKSKPKAEKQESETETEIPLFSNMMRNKNKYIRDLE
jgi:hypothetical protein